jgi:hypothetical protein
MTGDGDKGGANVAYEQMDTKRLRQLAKDLHYDSNHKMEPVKRQQAKLELAIVEAELRNRMGVRGIVRGIKKLLNSSG